MLWSAHCGIPDNTAVSDGVHLLDSLRRLQRARAAARRCGQLAPAAPAAAAGAPGARDHRRGDEPTACRRRTSACWPAHRPGRARRPASRWAAWQVRQAGRRRAGDDGLGLDHALPLARGHRPRRSWRIRRTCSSMPSDSQALLAAMQPYFEQDGIAPATTTRPRAGWPAASCSATCPPPRWTAWSAARIDAWMPRGDAGRPLRRLQQEMQMLLYTPPLNDERAARRPAAGQFLLGQRHRRAAGRRRSRRRAGPAGRRTTCATPRCADDWRGLGRRLAAARCDANARGCCKRPGRRPRRCASPCAASAVRAPGHAGDAGCWRRLRATCSRRQRAADAAGGPMKIITRDVPPRAAWALEQAGIHPLLARLYAARGVLGKDELDDGLARLLPPAGMKGAAEAARAAGRRHRRRQRSCASWPTTTATAPPPARSPCAACACWARSTSTTWCRTAWSTATA